MKAFRNEPFTDFTNSKNARKFNEALGKVHSEFNKEYPVIIGGEKIFTEDKITSLNPTNITETIGRVSKASPEMANRAIETAYAKFDEWKRVPAKKRADFLFKAAKIMRKRKFEFAAWMVYEVGKNWAEADGDVAEAIDFMEFYAREMHRYEKDDCFDCADWTLHYPGMVAGERKQKFQNSIARGKGPFFLC